MPMFSFVVITDSFLKQLYQFPFSPVVEELCLYRVFSSTFCFQILHFISAILVSG